MKRLCFIVAGILSAASLRAELISIGIDSWGAARNVTSITTAGVATPLFSLGDGSLSFNGGLAYRGSDDLLYGIANDSLGNSRLVSFSAGGGGAFTTIGPLGQGFTSGLAYNSADDRLYAISNDWTGTATLYRIDLQVHSSRLAAWERALMEV